MRRFLVILIGISILAYILLLIVISISRIGYSEVEVVTLPGNANLKVDTVGVGNRDSVFLKPGKYIIEASLDGFPTESTVVNTANSQYPVMIQLLDGSEKSTEWAENNVVERQNFEIKASQVANKKGSDFKEKHPITAELPFKNSLFSIGYRTDVEEEQLTLTITAPDVYIPYALTKIRSWGYNPADYEIVLSNQRSIFDER